MKPSHFSVALALMSLIALYSCSKDEISEEDKQKATAFKAAVVSKRFYPLSFYSDKPIDYITTDAEVRSETDLWEYVKPYIKDDTNYVITETEVKIYQNDLKKFRLDTAVLDRKFGVVAAKGGVFIDFVDYDYVPMRYRLHEFTNNHFVMYIDFKGARLFSKFQIATN